jgi:N-acetylglucosamine malate deacetylase 1
VSVVLAIGAHPDDVELACGATLAKHAAAGDYVMVAHLSSGHGARDSSSHNPRLLAAGAARLKLGPDVRMWLSLRWEDQQFDAVPLLEIVRQIETLSRDVEAPDIVYTHHEGDLNLDHAITARAVKTAFRPRPGVKAPKILAFEVLSSTELGAPFAPTVFVEASPEAMERKLAALREYGDEIPPAPHPRSLEAVQALATLRGAAIGRPAAEAFVLVREVI